MELHRLLTNAQTVANLCVRQSFNTAKSHLGFTPAQIVVSHHSLQRSFKIQLAFFDSGLCGEPAHAHGVSLRENFLRIAYQVLSSCIAVSVLAVALAFDTEFHDH